MSSGLQEDPAYHQCAAQKPASVMIWGYMSGPGMDSMHTCEGGIKTD